MSEPDSVSAEIYQSVWADGERELERGFAALWWSGIAAGLSIGFSVLAQALLIVHLPEGPWNDVIAPFGYCFGFLIVVIGQQQLFTENTLTAVLPVMANRSMTQLGCMLRLWTIVLAANVVGTSLFAVALSMEVMVPAEVVEAARGIGRHLLEKTFWEMFASAVVAGWLIAAMVWMINNVRRSKVIIVILITYLVALSGSSHIIAGSTEVILLAMEGHVSMWDLTWSFAAPTLAGNIFGGTTLFAVLAYAQVREEIAEPNGK